MKKISVIFILTLSLIFVGCSKEDDAHLNLTNYNETSKNQNEETKSSGSLFEKEVLNAVRVFEDDLNKLYELEMSLDEFVDNVTQYVSHDALVYFTDRLLYTPHINRGVIILDDEDYLEPIHLSDTRGYSLNDIKLLYEIDIKNYRQKYYGDYAWEETLYSDFFNDDYVKYIYTKNTINVERFGEDDITELIVYRIFTITDFEDRVNITKIEDFTCFDHTKSWMYDIIETQRPNFSEQIEKFTSFEGNTIKFK